MDKSFSEQALEYLEFAAKDVDSPSGYRPISLDFNLRKAQILATLAVAEQQKRMADVWATLRVDIVTDAINKETDRIDNALDQLKKRDAS